MTRDSDYASMGCYKGLVDASKRVFLQVSERSEDSQWQEGWA